MPKLSEINQKPPAYMAAIKAFVANPRGFLLIAGSNGVGKTFTARAIYEHFWTPVNDCQFWNQADLKIRWQELLAEYHTVSYFLSEIVKAPLLVLDDLGTTRPTEAFLEFLYIIGDKRHQKKHECGTIITTNMNVSSMREVFGDAFVSRTASGICIRLDGEDRRREFNF